MPYRKTSIDLPAMSPGSARSVVVHRFGRPGARPKAYLQAAIHANELPGAMALHHLMPMLVEADRAGRVRGEIVVVPVINPIGLAQLLHNNHLGRYDFVGRENFNRNWPELSEAVARRVDGRLGRNAADNVARIRDAVLAALAAMKPMNELQTLRVEALKRSHDADIVLDLHCDQHAVLHLFISRQDWPGPARILAADLGAEATLYNDPYPDVATFSGVNGALWPRLAAHAAPLRVMRIADAGGAEPAIRETADFVAEEIGAEAFGYNLPNWLLRREMVAHLAGLV